MIPRMKNVIAEDDYILYVTFDDGIIVRYDMKEDIDQLPGYDKLKQGQFSDFVVDESRTCISWTDEIDLPSDIIYEYGKKE